MYIHKGKNVLSVGGFKSHFCIWFYNGVFLKDKHKVLVNANEEKTKSLRQWRFTSKNEINEKLILEYIKEAIQIEKDGEKIPPTKSKPLPLPDLMKAEFKVNHSLKLAFEKLSPFKQKEYIEHIDSAKKEETKIARLEKMIPQILNGIGLHDKYR